MRVRHTIERIKEYSEKCHKQLPKLEEITNFENEILTLHKKMFVSEDHVIELIKKDAEKLQDVLPQYNKSYTLELKQKEEELERLRDKENELLKKLNKVDLKYKQNMKEKDLVVSAMKSLQTDQDMILAYKIGTLSHFSYSDKIKFGYFMNNKTLATKTFIYDHEKESSQAEVEQRWKQLESFIETSNH